MPWVGKDREDSVIAQTYDIPEIRSAQKICDIAGVTQKQMVGVLRKDRERLVAKQKQERQQLVAQLEILRKARLAA